MQLKLRPYQEKAIKDIRKAFADGYKRVCFQCGTGSGKTVIAAFVIQNAIKKGNKVLFLVHLKELVEQTSKKLTEIGVKHGIIASGEKENLQYPVQVAMIQSFSRRLNFKPDLIIYDECHHSRSNTFTIINEKYPDCKLLGLTATPQRLDGKGLGHIFDTLVKGPSLKDLIADNFLSDFELYSIPNTLDLSKVHIKFGDYNQADLEEALNKCNIFGDAVNSYKKFLEGKKVIAFTNNIENSKKLVSKMKVNGISAAHVDGQMKKKDRDCVIEMFRSGEIKVLSNCNLISEGFDVPDCDGVILLRPTTSLTLYLQSIGRALRPNDTKKAIILDHVKNYARHGFPDDDREWDLEDRIKKNKLLEKETNIRVCESCFVVYHGIHKLCPLCGYRNALKERRELKEIDIELVRIEKQTFTTKDINLLSSKCVTLEDFKKLAKQLGYADGWAWHRYQARKNKKNGRRN